MKNKKFTVFLLMFLCGFICRGAFAVTCNAGQGVNPDTGQCENCPQGYYSVGGEDVECVACPGNTSTSGTGASSIQACECNAGYEKVNGECVACGEGYYKSVLGNTACQQCPEGHYANTVGSINCQPCSTGHYAEEEGSTSCTACPKGKYQDLTGQSQCKPCNPGTYSNQQGLSSCVACPKGKYQPDSGKASCKSCPNGSSTEGTGADEESDCNICDRGWYSANGHTPCTMCPKGTHNSSYAGTSCDLCDRGSYADEEGLVNCKPCDEGTASNDTGRETACDVCQAGTYAHGFGNTGCSDCGEGQYSHSGAGSCKACPFGYCCANGIEYKCNRGTYADQEGTSCKTQQYMCTARGGGSGNGNGNIGIGPGISCPAISQTYYIKGECENSCQGSCTTEFRGAVANSECTVKTIKEFCISGGDCFSWPTDGSIYENAVNSNNVDFNRNVTCPDTRV